MEQVKKHTVNKLKLLKLNQNHGKGGAIRKGVMRASGRSILFADADGATEIRDLQKLEEVLLSCLEGREGVIVCGSRAHLEEEAIAQVCYDYSSAAYCFSFMLRGIPLEIC
jgi:dolichyl-phosphate beta-glucosyltransferase